MSSSINLTSLSPLVPYNVLEYIACIQLVQSFQSVHLDGDLIRAYDNLYGFNRLSAVGGWVKRWIHWGSRDAVLRCDKPTYVNMRFIRNTEEEVYVRCLA